MAFRDIASYFRRDKKELQREIKYDSSAEPIEIHEEIGDPSGLGEREYLHVILADLFDFVPPIVVTKMARFREEARYTNSFPVKKIDGPNLESYIQEAGYSQSLSALKQVVSELNAVLSMGMSAGERTPGHMLVDRSGKVWQIDLDGAHDFVADKDIGSSENLHVDFGSPDRLEKVKTDEVQERLEFVRNAYVHLVTTLIESVYNTYTNTRGFDEKKWKKSIFGTFIGNHDWKSKSEFENSHSLEEIKEGLDQLV
ncbi:MAG: hypothetical protein ABI758_00605 [Candidatus Woesebacteria bacterium]